MDELRKLSSRAEITDTSFTNTYNFGDFRGNPEKLMERYYDAFVYVANWGTNRLMFRIPRRLVDLETTRQYAAEDVLTIKASKTHVVIEFVSNEEGSDWSDGGYWMPKLIGIRAELMRGDLRALYLGWLSSIRSRFGYDDEDRAGEDNELEPPVPLGLTHLSSPLKALVEFLRIEDELIEVAAKGSGGEAPSEPSSEELTAWIRKLSAAEKNQYLLRFLAEEEDQLLRSELFQRYKESTKPRSARAAPTKRRVISELLSACDARIAEKRRRKTKPARKK